MVVGEIIGWMLMAIVKFIITPSIMITSGQDLLYTIMVSASGAILGFLIFYNLGQWMFDFIDSKRKKERKLTKGKIKMLRFIAKNGLWGLMLLAPAISVWLTGILASKFFSQKKYVQIIFCGAFTFWSVVLSLISHFVYSAI